MPAKKTIFSALLLKGFSAVVIQTLLIRELLIVFYGNELAFGLILAVWLSSGALGASVWASRFHEARVRPFTFFQAFLSIAAPLSLVLIRSYKMLFHIPFGEAFPLSQILVIAILSLAPVAAADGALFNMGFRLLSDKHLPAGRQSRMAKVYAWDSLGVICGGLLLTFILLSFLNAFQIVLLVSSLNLLCAYILIRRDPSRFLRAVVAVLFLNAVAFFCLSPQLQKLTLALQWQKKDLVAYQNSVYGNIAAIENEGQYTIYYDGLPSVSIPSPETYFTEDFIHLPLLSHPNAKNVLFIGTAAGGLLTEALKYPLKQAVYVEIDPVFIQVLQGLREPSLEKELSDPRVRIALEDGRTYLKNAKEKFDAVFVHAGLPTSLGINRYYTREFFEEVRRVLSPGGIAVFKTAGSLSYLSEELRHLNAVVLKTLSSVFPEISVIPGDGFNMFIASQAKHDLNAHTLSLRLKQRGFQTYLMNAAYIGLRLQKPYLDWFWTNIRPDLEKASINEDLRPTGLYEGLGLYYAQFSKKIPQLIGGFKTIRTRMLFLYIALFFLFWRWRTGAARTDAAAHNFTVFSTGAFSMAVQIIVLFLFQSYLGYLFQWLAILTTSFMAGASLGALTANRKLADLADTKKVALIEFGLPLCTTLLIFATIWIFQTGVSTIWGRWLFSLISLSAGFLVGLEIPVVFELYVKARRLHHTESFKAAGLFYCLDLIGACAGALLTPLVLIPSCGIIATVLILLGVKTANAAILWRLSQR